MNKNELRKAYLAKRRAIEPHQRLKFDDLLLINLQKITFDDEVNCLFTYFPIEKFGEPNTFIFTRYMQFVFPELQVAYPKTDWQNHQMHALIIEEESSYEKNPQGLYEPVSEIIVDPRDIDVVFVPLLAFDTNGYRVGFGKGYYDKFLTTCREDVLKIGFSYFPPVDEIEDVSDHDIALDYCITCDAVYAF